MSCASAPIKLVDKQILWLFIPQMNMHEIFATGLKVSKNLSIGE